MNGKHPDPIVRLYRVCDPKEALPAEDPRYVNCDQARHESIAEAFARSIRRADPDRPEYKLFAGHMGVGKSTELMRLKLLLEKPPGEARPVQVVYFDVTRPMDPEGLELDQNDIELADLLILTTVEAQKQLKAANVPGFSPTNTYLNGLWDDLKGLLTSDVTFSGVEAEVGLAKVVLALKRNPSSRRAIRDAIERHSSPLLSGLNDILIEARAGLAKMNKDGPVLIIDGLEKVTYRLLEDGKSNTHDRLFIDRRNQLASLNAHVVYTIPISLMYSPRAAELRETFGEQIGCVPMISLRGKGRGPITRDTDGMQKLREIFEKRCSVANVAPTQVFDNRETLDFLCEMTGGHPRHLLLFLRTALNNIAEFPISRAAAEEAVGRYAISLQSEIPPTYLMHLKKFSQPKGFIPSDVPDEVRAGMLHWLYVFEYLNGARWYDLNPVVKRTQVFQE